MEIIDEHGELCAFCSDDPQDFIHIQPVEAIRLLTLKYIEQCGVSLGMRTLYYNAAEAWQEISSIITQPRRGKRYWLVHQTIPWQNQLRN